MYHSILPGKIWLDTEGKRIQAHGGSVLYQDGIYYWYGENKEKTTGDNGIWHWGVRCYTSTDLYNWEDEGAVEFSRKFGSDAQRNTSIADYVWLPFRFDKEIPYLEWMDEWRIEDYD